MFQILNIRSFSERGMHNGLGVLEQWSVDKKSA